MPALRVVGPVLVLLPERVSVPFPALVIPKFVPEMTPETVRLASPTVPPLLTVQVWLAPSVMFEEIVSVIAVVFAELVAVRPPWSVMLPPERVMFEDEPTSVMVFALTLPETVIVPVASWAEEVPKFRASVVVVVVVPERAVPPVESVLQP